MCWICSIAEWNENETRARLPHPLRWGGFVRFSPTEARRLRTDTLSCSLALELPFAALSPFRSQKSFQLTIFNKANYVSTIVGELNSLVRVPTSLSSLEILHLWSAASETEGTDSVSAEWAGKEWILFTKCTRRLAKKIQSQSESKKETQSANIASQNRRRQYWIFWRQHEMQRGRERNEITSTIHIVYYFKFFFINAINCSIIVNLIAY